jgi:hypothetical protein
VKSIHCSKCGSQMNEFDLFGNQVWNCPKDCEFEKVVEENDKILNERIAEDLEMTDILEEPNFSEDEILFYQDYYDIPPHTDFYNQSTYLFVADDSSQIIDIKTHQHFRYLTAKYRICDSNSCKFNFKIYEALCALENNSDLNESSLDWLCKNYQHTILSHYYILKYRQKKDPWDLAKACSSFRKCGWPEDAIAVTQGFESNDKKIMSAILTTRGGAHRDLRQLQMAFNCAEDAINYNDKSPHPYNLKGAICFDQCKFEEGLTYFNIAAELGANKSNQDKQIKTILLSDYPCRTQLATFLYNEDPERYGWALSYK